MTMMTTTAVDRLGFIKVVVTSCLLFFICFIGLLSTNPTIEILTESGKTITYPFYDRVSKTVNINTTTPYKRKLSYWVEDAANELSIFILIVILIIRADMSKLGFDLWYVWAFFAFLMFMDHILFKGRLPWGFKIELLLMIVQSVYVFYYWYLWKNEEGF